MCICVVKNLYNHYSNHFCRITFLCVCLFYVEHLCVCHKCSFYTTEMDFIFFDSLLFFETLHRVIYCGWVLNMTVQYLFRSAFYYFLRNNMYCELIFYEALYIFFVCNVKSQSVNTLALHIETTIISMLGCSKKFMLNYVIHGFVFKKLYSHIIFFFHIIQAFTVLSLL